MLKLIRPRQKLLIVVAALLCGSPTEAMDIEQLADGGRRISLAEGDNFSEALKRVELGDEIVLPAGAEFVGSFTLPKKSKPAPQGRSPWITIRTSALDRLPPIGNRVTPTDAQNMPKIVTPNAGPAINSAFGAHHYHFVGIEITTTAKKTYDLVRLGFRGSGSGERAKKLKDLPYRFVFERCYLHGNATGDLRTGIAMNAKDFAILDSYISEVHESGSDAQALLSTNGTGPFKIINNFLEASGENVMFGGEDPKIPQLVPSDIEIFRNHISKPDRWNAGQPSKDDSDKGIPAHPDYDGSRWSIKNLLELKNARRVHIEGNVFENCWAQSQSGYAILFTPRNQQGKAEWSTVENVVFTNNIIRKASAFMMILSQDNEGRPSRQAKDITIRNNLITNIAQKSAGGQRVIFDIGGGKKLSPVKNIRIENNTALFSKGGKSLIVLGDSGKIVDGFVCRNNILASGNHGIAGTDSEPGIESLNRYLKNWTFRNNLLIGKVRKSMYPVDNFFVPSLTEVGFVDPETGNHELLPTSPYREAGDRNQPLGVDMEALRLVTEGVIEGLPMQNQ